MSDRRLPALPGNTWQSASIVRQARARSKIARASADRVMVCASPFLRIIEAGRRHSPAARSNCDHMASLTSPLRAAVKIVNSRASRPIVSVLAFTLETNAGNSS